MIKLACNAVLASIVLPLQQLKANSISGVATEKQNGKNNDYMVIIEVTFNIYPFPFYKIVKTLRTYTRIQRIVWNYRFSSVQLKSTSMTHQQHEKKKTLLTEPME